MMQRWTILLIDDDAMVLQVHGRYLDCMGHDVVMHTSPLKALEQFRGGEHAFDLLITDFKMPEMDGLELVRQARASSYAGPVLLLTAYDHGAHIDEADQLELDVMLKPVRYYELVEYVRRLQKRLDPPRASGLES
jgi:DNA-binding response OmpR family regulator